jgi:hypothetical protein
VRALLFENFERGVSIASEVLTVEVWGILLELDESIVNMASWPPLKNIE